MITSSIPRLGVLVSAVAVYSSVASAFGLSTPSSREVDVEAGVRLGQDYDLQERSGKEFCVSFMDASSTILNESDAKKIASAEPLTVTMEFIDESPAGLAERLQEKAFQPTDEAIDGLMAWPESLPYDAVIRYHAKKPLATFGFPGAHLGRTRFAQDLIGSGASNADMRRACGDTIIDRASVAAELTQDLRLRFFDTRDLAQTRRNLNLHLADGVIAPATGIVGRPIVAELSVSAGIEHISMPGASVASIATDEQLGTYLTGLNQATREIQDMNFPEPAHSNAIGRTTHLFATDFPPEVALVPPLSTDSEYLRWQDLGRQILIAQAQNLADYQAAEDRLHDQAPLDRQDALRALKGNARTAFDARVAEMRRGLGSGRICVKSFGPTCIGPLQAVINAGNEHPYSRAVLTP